MSITHLLLALAAAIAGTGFLYALTASIRDGRVRASRRAAFLDDVQCLFTGGLKKLQPDGFPRISGTYRGATFDIQLVPDTLNFRKLPSLWLLVSLPEPMPVKATFDLMMRPRGVEVFSRHAALPVQMAPDPAFPHDCTVRTDAPQLLPPRQLLLKHAAILDDPRAKELVISPKGLRIVWLTEEASRGSYLLFRDSEMGLQPFPAAAAKPLLDYLLDLRDDLLAHPETAS
ncbi:hypothetical protein DK847_09875 [Aestuariivirga litoralis]|uniref:DUF3137 domain-containing protein n=1 Tax=Aestuariivirga litoralis TaxID=2650924 RepID=A0A2W2AT03_9HYPH|nr:hypothetical protein [Aestuariivirga litoralis]PZF76772.1 hypothetical protein DK847_09875 [Aestuariivirga litoralis]